MKKVTIPIFEVPPKSEGRSKMVNFRKNRVGNFILRENGIYSKKCQPILTRKVTFFAGSPYKTPSLEFLGAAKHPDANSIFIGFGSLFHKIKLFTFIFLHFSKKYVKSPMVAQKNREKGLLKKRWARRKIGSYIYLALFFC